MTLVREIEKVIATLPLSKARMLKFWLNEYQAVRRYNHLKAYSKAVRTLAKFEKSNGHARWN